MPEPDLSLLQKLLLATDGTVTQLLELYTGRPIRVRKLHQALAAPPHSPLLQTRAGDQVLERAILLHDGARNLLYAESRFVMGCLPETMHRQLLESEQPIGSLWRTERLETYREVVATGCQPEPALCQHFAVAPGQEFLSRTYLIFRQLRPMGMITEKFPASQFRD